MKTTTLLTAMLLAWTTHVDARLGETRQQCDKRYGKPANLYEDGSVLYKKGAITLSIHFFEGRAWRIGYGKVDEEWNRKPISRSEALMLMKASGGDRSWKTDGSLDEWCLTNDGEMAAALFVNGLLIVKDLRVAKEAQAKEDADKQRAQAKAARAEQKKLEKALEGF